MWQEREGDEGGVTNNLLKEQEKGELFDGALSGKGRPPTAGSGARVRGRRSIGSLAELRKLERTEHGEQMTQHGEPMTEQGRQQRKEQARRGSNSGPLRVSPSVRRRNRSMGNEDAPFESTLQGQQPPRTESPSAQGNWSTGDDAAPFESTQQAKQSPRNASPSTQASRRCNRSMGGDAAPFDAAPVSLRLPKSRLGSATAASHGCERAHDEEGNKADSGQMTSPRGAAALSQWHLNLLATKPFCPLLRLWTSRSVSPPKQPRPAASHPRSRHSLAG
ncbi:unnamed protein product [Closterium sp. Naga37s-1]|nr:unnamed protein product [Closterium sp. Naga37s-1]